MLHQARDYGRSWLEVGGAQNTQAGSLGLGQQTHCTGVLDCAMLCSLWKRCQFDGRWGLGWCALFYGL